MSAEEMAGGLHAALARMVWDAAPGVRLHVHTGDDALVVEVVQADDAVTVEVSERLVVDFDGTDPAAMPTALTVTGLLADPGSADLRLARDILGERIWAQVHALVARGGGTADVDLDAAEASVRRTAWRGLAGRLRAPAMIGVEFTPGRVYAVLTDARARVLDEEAVDLTGNGPDDVVAAVAAVAGALAGRHPGTDAGSCPIGLQLGGPVHTDQGLVEFYDKPFHDGDDCWLGVPLGDLVERATGRPARIFNDARAFAEQLVGSGEAGPDDAVVLLVVRQGIGAKLVLDGAVAERFPMEFGVLLDDGATLEARSGVLSIIAGVEAALGRPLAPDSDPAATGAVGRRLALLPDAVAAAAGSEAALAVFAAAGRTLARGMAMMQALLNPDRFVVLGPAALVDGAGPASRAFLTGLGAAHEFVGFGGLWPGSVVARSTTGPLGAVAAAVAALRAGHPATTGHR